MKAPVRAQAGNSLWHIFRWPLLLGLLSAFGLLAALVGDGSWDLLGWLALLPPVLLAGVGVMKAWRRQPR